MNQYFIKKHPYQRLLLIGLLYLVLLPSLHARHEDGHTIYESFTHCKGTYATEVWTEFTVKDGIVMADNTVESLTGKYLGCRSDYGKLADGTIVDTRPENGIIGIRYHEFQLTDKIDLTLNKGPTTTSSYTSATGHIMDVYALYHFSTIDVTIDLGIENIKSLVLFDVLAEHGCINKEKRNPLISAFNFPPAQKVKNVTLRIKMPCKRHFEITSDHVVESFPYEFILLMRVKTYDEQYFYRVKKIITY